VKINISYIGQDGRRASVSGSWLLIDGDSLRVVVENAEVISQTLLFT